MPTKKRAQREAAVRKQKSREKQRNDGFVRLETRVEIKSIRLLEQIGEDRGITVSEVVRDLIHSCILMVPHLKWITRDMESIPTELLLTKDERSYLLGDETLSAGGVIEHLLLDHMVKWEDGSLVYVHPEFTAATPYGLLTGWYPENLDAREPHMREWSKYTERKKRRDSIKAGERIQTTLTPEQEAENEEQLQDIRMERQVNALVERGNARVRTMIGESYAPTSHDRTRGPQGPHRMWRPEDEATYVDSCANEPWYKELYASNESGDEG